MGFRDKPMFSLKTAALFAGMASAMVLIFVPYHVRSMLQEPSLTRVALLLSLPAVATLLATNFWGAVSDITGFHGRVTALCLMGYTLSLIIIPFLDETASVITTIAILSLLYGAVRPLLLTHATLLNESDKPAALSAVFFYESMGFFVGGLLFGFVCNQNQAWAGAIIFPLSGTCCLAAAVMMLWTPRCLESTAESEHRTGSATARLLTLIKNDLSEVYHSRPLLRLSLVVLLASIANFCFFGMFFAFYTEGIGGSGSAMSLTLSISTAIGMATFPVARKLVATKGGLVVLKGAVVMWIADYILLGINTSPILASVLFVLPIYPFFLVSANYLAAEASRSERRGAGLGALAGVAAISMGLGTILGGSIGDHLGLMAVPYVAALFSMTAFAAAVFMLKAPKMKENQNER